MSESGLSVGAAGPPLAFGLIVIGDEVLNGPRADEHLTAFKGLLAGRGHQLAWCWVLPDDPPVLVRHLRWSLAGDVPVFCCGGIGATPDDHTRACVAEAAGVALVRHGQAQALIEGRFGAEAWPHRVRMADLPAGSRLIPNPYNQVPGFALGQHWFLPGFPRMAWPMAEWILDGHYPPGVPAGEVAVRVFDVPESRLIPLMERIGEAFPRLKLFSLPHLGARGVGSPAWGGDAADGATAVTAGVDDEPHILLGFRGRGDLEGALTALTAELDREGVRWA